VSQDFYREFCLPAISARLLAEMKQQSQNRAMETAAPVETVEKTNRVFPTVPTALGKLDQERRVSHSSHSPYG
jgi:hypothetical protein